MPRRSISNIIYLNIKLLSGLDCYVLLTLCSVPHLLYLSTLSQVFLWNPVEGLLFSLHTLFVTFKLMQGSYLRTN